MEDLSDNKVEGGLNQGLTKSDIAIRKFGSAKKTEPGPAPKVGMSSLSSTLKKTLTYSSLLPKFKSPWCFEDACLLIKSREIMTGCGRLLKIRLERMNLQCEKWVKEDRQKIVQEARSIKRDKIFDINMPETKARNRNAVALPKASLPQKPSSITMVEVPSLRLPEYEVYGEDKLIEQDKEIEMNELMNIFSDMLGEPRGVESQIHAIDAIEPIRQEAIGSLLHRATDAPLLEQLLDPTQGPVAPEALTILEPPQPAPIAEIPRITITYPSWLGAKTDLVPKPRPRKVSHPAGDDNVFSKKKIRRTILDIKKLLYAPDEDILDPESQELGPPCEDYGWNRWEDEFDVACDLKMLRRTAAENDVDALAIYKERFVTRVKCLEEADFEIFALGPNGVPTSEQPNLAELPREPPLPCLGDTLLVPPPILEGHPPDVTHDALRLEPTEASLLRDAQDMVQLPLIPEIMPHDVTAVNVGDSVPQDPMIDMTAAKTLDVTLRTSVRHAASKDPFKCPQVQPSESDESLDLSIRVKRDESMKTIRQELRERKELSFGEILPQLAASEEKTIWFLCLLHLCQSGEVTVTQTSASVQDIQLVA